MGSCTAPSAKGDDKFITTDYLQQCQVNYPDDFVKQAWEQPEINLFIVCVATKKGAVREIKEAWPYLLAYLPVMGLSYPGLLMTFLENLMNSARSQVRKITSFFRQKLVLLATPYRTRVA
jgi:hypothetical protein